MNRKINRVMDIVLPNKKINLFVISIVVIGIITGSIFFTFISDNDKNKIIEIINNFISSVNSSFDSGLAFKNSLITNIILVSFIFVFGMSIIGLFINVFIIYIKAFLVGFTVSSIIASLGIKGLLLAFLYVFPSQIINLIIIITMGIYSIIFSIYLIKLITNKNNKSNNVLKKYMIIFLFSIIGITISSFYDGYLFSNIFKLFINIYT